MQLVLLEFMCITVLLLLYESRSHSGVRGYHIPRRDFYWQVTEFAACVRKNFVNFGNLVFVKFGEFKLCAIRKSLFFGRI